VLLSGQRESSVTTSGRSWCAVVLVSATAVFLSWTLWLLLDPGLRQKRQNTRLQVIDRLSNVERALQDLTAGAAVIPDLPRDLALNRWRVLFLTYRRQIEQLDGRDPAVQQIMNSLGRVYSLVGQAEEIRKNILAEVYPPERRRAEEVQFRKLMEEAAGHVRQAAQTLRESNAREDVNPLSFPLYPLFGGVLSSVLLLSYLRNRSQWMRALERAKDTAAPTVEAWPLSRDLTVPSSGAPDSSFTPNGYDALRRLAGKLAHNLNNLLTTINGYADLLLHSLEGKDPIRGDLEHIQRAGERAAFLAFQLLTFAGMRVSKPEQVDLNQSILKLEPAIRSRLGPQIGVVMELSRDPIPVKLDPAQFEQALMSLVANAHDAMAGGGQLYIVTALETRPPDPLTPGPCARMTIRDTGPGMDGETLQRIFEPFFTTKETGQGIGLGLSAVYGIVRRHGGQIRVHSEKGKGAAFDLYFPLTGAAVEERKAPRRFTVQELTSGSVPMSRR